jgi:hypothetical protein
LFIVSPACLCVLSGMGRARLAPVIKPDNSPAPRQWRGSPGGSAGGFSRRWDKQEQVRCR